MIVITVIIASLQCLLNRRATSRYRWLGWMGQKSCEAHIKDIERQTLITSLFRSAQYNKLATLHKYQGIHVAEPHSSFKTVLTQ